MTPNLQKYKIQQTIRTVSPMSKMMTSTNTPHLNQHSFLTVQFHMHGCTILCTYLCWQSYLLREKCRHGWICVGWCIWTFAQVCTHTSARCYTLLAFDKFDTDAPTSADIGTSQWFPSLGPWTHLFSCVGDSNPSSEVFGITSYLIQDCI